MPIHFGEVAKAKAINSEKKIQFSQVIFEINPLFKMRCDVSITDIEDKYLKNRYYSKYSEMQQLMTETCNLPNYFKPNE